LVVGTIRTGAVRDDVKLSVSVTAPDALIFAVTLVTPSSWKFPVGVWTAAAYGSRGTDSHRT
jgi:hypothetical protein